MLDIDILDLLSPWRPFEFGTVPTPTLSTQHGTGGTKQAIRPQMAEYWRLKEQFEYDAKLARAIAKAKRQKEEDEALAVMEMM